MNLVQSKLLYDRLKKSDVGLYVWVDPSSESILDLQELLKDAPFKVENTTEWHVTLLYCKDEKLPEKLEFEEPNSITARALLADIWENHKGEEICVLLLESDDLQGIHYNLTKQGLSHSFPDYNPHLTLSYKFGNTPEARVYLSDLNYYLTNYPVFLTFSDIKGSRLA